MFDNYLVLKRLSKELENELKDFKFFKSISQSKNELVTGFFNNDTEKFLVFTFQKLPPLIYLRENFSFAKKNFAEFFNLLKDADLKSITIDDYERNIRFKFQNYELIFLFRGNHSNVVLIDDKNLIIDCYKKKDECLHKNFNQIYPASEIDLSFFNDESKFNSLFENPPSDSKKYLKIIGSTLVLEIKYRAENSGKSYFEIFKQIQNEMIDSPLFVYDEIISFCNLYHLNEKPYQSNSIFDDLSRVYFTIQKNKDIEQLKEKIINKLKAEYESHFKKLQLLRAPENFIDRTEEFRQIGNLILINANKIKKGDRSFKTSFEGKNYNIKLDPTKTPFQNAEDYFEKAREENSRLVSLKKLIEKNEKELEQIKELIEEIENTIDRKYLMEFINKQNQQSKEKEITSHFRHFVINEKYDVYAGKDNKSNDILTTQFAKPDDLWFHARGVSGSHLIIRRTNKKEVIPKDVIEKAASIAAFYSKAKHSKLVPVIYTEKKYVIKRKGMPPGTVQVQKEKVIMVEPKIPSQDGED